MVLVWCRQIFVILGEVLPGGMTGSTPGLTGTTKCYWSGEEKEIKGDVVKIRLNGCSIGVKLEIHFCNCIIFGLTNDQCYAQI